jgi:hypothetical protein
MVCTVMMAGNLSVCIDITAEAKPAGGTTRPYGVRDGNRQSSPGRGWIFAVPCSIFNA